MGGWTWAPWLLILAFASWGLRVQGLSSEEDVGGPGGGANVEQTPTPEEGERPPPFAATTAPTLKALSHHHPPPENFLHEALLEKDYLGRVPFPEAQLDARTPSGVPTASAATTTTSEAPKGPEAERAPDMARPALTSDHLTTAMGRVAPWGPRDHHPAPTASGAPSATRPTERPQGSGPRGVPSRKGEQEATTTTIVPAVPAAGGTPCSWNLTGPRGSLASPLPSTLPPEGVALECIYTISVYPGYGVEIRVQNISLSEGETLAVEALGVAEPIILANESFLMRGQVIRGASNRVGVRFQSPSPLRPGSFLLRYEAYLLSCPFPSRPADGGDPRVSSLHPGGQACFSCGQGYRLSGPRCLSCLNATQPFWSGKEPTCLAACGGVIRKAGG